MGLDSPIFEHSPRATRAVEWIAEMISDHLHEMNYAEDWSRRAWDRAENFSDLGIWSEGQRFFFATRDIYRAWRQHEARIALGWFDQQ